MAKKKKKARPKKKRSTVEDILKEAGKGVQQVLKAHGNWPQPAPGPLSKKGARGVMEKELEMVLALERERMHTELQYLEEDHSLRLMYIEKKRKLREEHEERLNQLRTEHWEALAQDQALRKKRRK